ncbi:MAG: class II fructose-bisphosphate aldolase [Candidatus Omnitrophica bacterium]|nr:class II fructose-bisphosphate aldolase [Candidatus Omnitrophota bacterium]
MNIEKVLEKRPKNAAKKLGENNKLLALSGHSIFAALKDKKVIVMACNIRIKHVVPGILRAADELDAVVGFELARSEGNLKGGYTGFTPYTFFEMITGYANKLNYKKPFFIHADHTTVKDTSAEEFQTAESIIKAAIEAGYGSIAIDASHNEVEHNVGITSKLGKLIQDAGLGLEAEIGEIKLVKEGGALSTVEESLEFIGGLKKNGINPDLLAINNGSKHGNYAPGEEVHIDLKRTGEIYEAVKKYGVCIAQHGITGTPLEIVGKFADYGIRKGNVGTEWQNIAHKHLPKDLFAEMEKWCKENGKDIKMATKPFKDKIDNIADTYKKETEDEAYVRAKEFITGFRARGTATMVMEALSG